jgi:septal ring factor EnvC (AmiA/AmiB activator)
MNSATVLTILTGALGGGGIAGLVQVARLRSGLRNEDAQSDQIEASIADQIAKLATAEAQRQAVRNEELERRIDTANKRASDLADEVENLHRELRTARRLIARLEERFESAHHTAPGQFPPGAPRDPSTRSRQDDA